MFERFNEKAIKAVMMAQEEKLQEIAVVSPKSGDVTFQVFHGVSYEVPI